MEDNSDSPILDSQRQRSRIASGADNDEQMRALKMLQRGLAERIREYQQGPANQNS